MSPSSLDRLPLRERKKMKTRRAIQEHALRLFEAQGYDATTVEQIAEAAEISPSTFFRYFPTKEDVVISDEYDRLMIELYKSQPTGSDPVEALRETFRMALSEMAGQDERRLLARVKLIESVPALRSRAWDLQQQGTYRIMIELLAERLDRPLNDFEIQIFVGALIGMIQAVISMWAARDGKADVEAMMLRAFDHLSDGFTLGAAASRPKSSPAPLPHAG